MPECAHPCAAAWAGACARGVSPGWPVLHRTLKVKFALLLKHAAS